MTHNPRTPAEQAFETAARAYVVARETPGVASESHYHRMRRALRALEREREREREAA